MTHPLEFHHRGWMGLDRPAFFWRETDITNAEWKIVSMVGCVCATLRWYIIALRWHKRRETVTLKVPNCCAEQRHLWTAERRDERRWNERRGDKREIRWDETRQEGDRTGDLSALWEALCHHWLTSSYSKLHYSCWVLLVLLHKKQQMCFLVRRRRDRDKMHLFPAINCFQHIFVTSILIKG